MKKKNLLCNLATYQTWCTCQTCYRPNLIHSYICRVKQRDAVDQPMKTRRVTRKKKNLIHIAEPSREVGEISHATPRAFEQVVVDCVVSVPVSGLRFRF